MKKAFTMILTALFAFGTLFGCGKKSEDNHSGSDSAQELISKVRYTSSYNHNGTLSERELIMNFTWTDSGATMEGYEQANGAKNSLRIEATLDDQKRPLFMEKTSTGMDETETISVNLSYPGPLEVHMKTQHSGGSSNEITYQYDSNGHLILGTYETYTKGSEFDDHGNCVREWIEYQDEELTDWVANIRYTYDDSGKALLGVRTRSDNDFEEQQHFYYYPNGNVMCIMYVTSHGDVNFGFRPYNTKDYIGWSYGRSAGGFGNYQVEKNEDGLITKVVRTTEFSDEAQTATFDYDNRGNLIREVSFSGTVRTWEYDEQNRIVKRIENQNQNEGNIVRTTAYEYDEQGRLISEKMTGTDGSSNTQTLAYNEAGMVTERSYEDVRIYDDETVISRQKMEIEYIENSNCTVSDEWAEFYLKNLISGL